MYIAKKDLLKITGISYGQLYRWKREKLIPEDWFVKQASKTGQETFFPKEKILNRIQTILRFKDQYSLEKLADMLSPELSYRLFTEDEIEKLEELDIGFTAYFMDALGKDVFTFTEVLLMMALSQFRKTCNLREEEVRLLALGISGKMIEVKSMEYFVALLEMEGMHYVAFMPEEPSVILENRMKIVDKVHLGDLSNQMKLKYQNMFDFAFDEEANMSEGVNEA